MTARDDGIKELALPDMERRVANTIRVGKVSAVDLAAARVRITSGNITTGWLPWSTGRASTKKRRWDPPAVGEQVVLLSPGGDLRQAVVLTGVFQSSAAAPASSGDKDTTVYGDGTVVEYDQSSHTLVVNLGDGNSKITVTRTSMMLEIGDTSLTMTAAGSVFEGPVTINGLLTYTEGLAGSGSAGSAITGDFRAQGGVFEHNSKNVGSDHTHVGVTPGGGTTGVPT